MTHLSTFGQAIIFGFGVSVGVFLTGLLSLIAVAVYDAVRRK